MIRGGSWNNNPQNCRVANRNNNAPGNRNNNLGFRLANTGNHARNCRLYGCGRCGLFLSSLLSCPRCFGANIYLPTRLVGPISVGLKTASAFFSVRSASQTLKNVQHGHVLGRLRASAVHSVCRCRDIHPYGEGAERPPKGKRVKVLKG